MNRNAGDSQTLDRECNVFFEYLTGQGPTDYVLQKYRDANRNLFTSLHTSRFDNFLLSISSRYRLASKLVDVYTSVFHKRSIVRKKCILLLAILESCPISSEYVDFPDDDSKFMLWTKMFLNATGFFIVLIISMILLLPFHLLLWTRS
jgi:hypothetical protein